MDNIRLLVVFLVVTLGLVGCVDTKPSGRPYPSDPYYKQIVRSAIGKPLNRLVRQWGFPDNTYSTNDIKFVIYNKPLRYKTPNLIYPQHLTLLWQTAYCTYTFELSKKDIILRGKGEGWACPLYRDEIYNGIEFGKTRPWPKK